MAKAKKKESTLTLEEKLAQALVPESEQPYKVPKNWCWVRLGNLISTSKEKTEEFSDDTLRYVGLEHIEKDNGIIGYSSAKEIKSLKNVFRVGQLLYGKLRPYLNKHDISFFDGVCSTDILVFDALETTIPQYVDYYFNQQYFIEYAVSNSKGINLPRVSESVILEAVCPLPPLSEQQRIVERVESLFSKLDEAKEKLQQVLDGFETRKAAILHKAFTGELTAKWREENGVSLESWEKRSLNSVCHSIFDGDHMPPPKSESGVPFLVISNVNTGHLSFNDIRYVPEEYYNNLSETRRPRLGDVLCTIVGTFGIPVIVDSDRKFCFQRHMALLKPRDITTKFLWYLLQWNTMYSKLADIATGTAQLTVPIKGLRAIEFLQPTLQEQMEIVEIIDDILSKSVKIKNVVVQSLKNIDSIKKAILACAFRGELGTNDENDECAVELLKKVL